MSSPNLYDAWFSEKAKLSKKMYKAYVEHGDVRNSYKNIYWESHISHIFRNINGKETEITEFYPVHLDHKPKSGKDIE